MLNSQNTIVKAIGIPQPQAWLVMNGYLNRVPAGQYTGHHGRLLVYALPQRLTEADYQQFKSVCESARIESFPKISEFDTGGFLGRVTVVDYEAGADGGSLLVLGEAEELGFRPSLAGRDGVFDVQKNPFGWKRAYRPVVNALPDEPVPSKTKWRHWAAKFRDGVQEHIVPEAGKIAKEIKEAALAEIRERIRARIHRIFTGGRWKRR
jgi:hypothetical protein